MASSIISLATSLSVILLLCNSNGVNSQSAVAQAAITKSIAAVQTSIQVAKLVSNAGNKQIVDTCLDVLSESIENLKDTSAAINAGRTDDARTRASAALTDVDTCVDEFEGSPPVPLRNALDAAEIIISQVLAAIK